MPLIELLDLAGVAVFAVSGALLAASRRQTLVTFIFFAVVTGVGGDADPEIGIVLDPEDRNVDQQVARGAAAVLVWALPARLWNERALLWFDAVGLAAYASYGAAKGLAFDVAPIPAIGMGVVTGCLGGIIRDVLAGEPSILMRPELYVTAAALSAALTVLLMLLGVPAFIAGVVAALAGFTLRGAAIGRGWALPAYER